MAKSKENKDLLELGKKQRAGMILSQYLRAIACEMTEVEDVPTGPDEVRHKVITKAEKLARDMWEKALRSGDKKEMLEYRKLVIERTDGKAGTVNDTVDDGKESIPDKISAMNKRRLNSLAEETVEE